MFDEDDLQQIKSAVEECTLQDRHILDELREEVRTNLTDVHTIKSRSTTSVSVVASDGGNNKLVFDPFYIQLVRVVDSFGKRLCLEAISPSTDLDALYRRQFDKEGKPQTSLGKLIHDLKKRPSSLHSLSPMIPDAQFARENPNLVSPSWVQVYRDLCEWAVLYERICHSSFATNTLIVRDGLLRSKIFSGEYFIEMCDKMKNAIEAIYKKDKLRIYLVGLAKHSKVLERYNLAIGIERLFNPGDALYVEIPRSMERKAYVWPEYARGTEMEGEGEAPKFVAGSLYFVRFGSRIGDPTWTVDILSSQKDNAQEIFGYLLADAIDGFPVPFYPRCLQKAHEFAQIVDFDLDILQDQVITAVRKVLPESGKETIDLIPFKSDFSERRYG